MIFCFTFFYVFFRFALLNIVEEIKKTNKRIDKFSRSNSSTFHDVV